MKPTPAQTCLRAVRLAAGAAAFALFLLAAGGLAGRLAHRAGAFWLRDASGGVVAAQAGPALLRCVASFSAGTLAVALVHALVALLFGRVFCSVLCPLGIWQDIVGRLARVGRGRRRRAKESSAAFARRASRERLVRYVATGLCFGALAMGASAGLLALEPYSNAYRGAHSLLRGPFLWGAVALPLAVTALAAWRGRLYCTALCPVGTALGLLARAAPFRMRLNGSCVKCGACASACPSRCIDVAGGTVDNERCVRCLACVSVCRVRGIGYGAACSGMVRDVPFSASRRAFLKGGLALAAGLAAGATLARTGLRRMASVARRALGILPPGAGNPERFAAKCTGCLRCVGVCKGRILQPAPGGFGPVRVDLSRGACQYHCHHCAEACPTGAIRRMPRPEKQRTRIAQVEFHADHCIVFQAEEWCGRCVDACPTGAISLRRNGTPKVSHPERCIGCGACQLACPGWRASDDPPGAPPKAMRVAPLPNGVQETAADPDPTAIPDPPRHHGEPKP